MLRLKTFGGLWLEGDKGRLPSLHRGNDFGAVRQLVVAPQRKKKDDHHVSASNRSGPKLNAGRATVIVVPCVPRHRRNPPLTRVTLRMPYWFEESLRHTNRSCLAQPQPLPGITDVHTHLEGRTGSGPRVAA